MAKTRIFVDRQGNVLTLLNPKIEAIKDYGDRRIERASMVEFNNNADKWFVYMPDNEYDRLWISYNLWPVIAREDTRELAIAAEVKILENRYRQKLQDGKLLVPGNSRCAFRMEAIQSPRT